MSNFIDVAIENLKQQNAIERDVQDQATISKVIATLRGIKAKNQKEHDTAMGIGPKEKFIRRAHGAY